MDIYHIKPNDPNLQAVFEMFCRLHPEPFIVQKYLPEIRRAATQAVQKVGVVGPKPDSSVTTYKGKMSDYVEGQIKVVMDQMYKERKARQARVDTKEEYDRVDGLCPHE